MAARLMSRAHLPLFLSCMLVILVGADAIIDSFVSYACPVEFPPLTKYRADELNFKPEDWEAEMIINYECGRQYECLPMSEVKAAIKRAEVTGL